MASLGMEDTGEEKAADKNGTSTHMCYGVSSHCHQSTCKDKCSDW